MELGISPVYGVNNGFCTHIQLEGQAAGQIVLRPFVTMLDWLSVTASGPFWSVHLPVGEWAPWQGLEMRPGAFLLSCDPPREWGKRFYLMDSVGGEKLLTILAAPTNRKIHARDAMVIQFHNQTLAPGEWRELGNALWAAGCTFTGVQRIDIAADGWLNEVRGAESDSMDAAQWQFEPVGGGGDFIQVVQAALAGFGRYYGKARWGTEHLGNAWNGFNFGTRAANKFLRCYRKKREMKAKGHKPHIAAAWAAALNGYDAMRDPREVGRLEVQMKGREFRRYYGGEGDWAKLCELHDPVLRAGIYAGAVESMYDFRTWPMDGRARSAVPMARWDWSAACNAPPPKFTREKRRLGIGEARVKTVLHYLHDLAWITGDPDAMAHAERLAAAAGDGMTDYLRRKSATWAAQCAQVISTAPVADGLERIEWQHQDDPRARYARTLFTNLGAMDAARRDERLAAFLANHSAVADVPDDEADEFVW